MWQISLAPRYLEMTTVWLCNPSWETQDPVTFKYPAALFLRDKLFEWRESNNPIGAHTEQNASSKMPKEFMEEYQPLLVKEIRDRERIQVRLQQKKKSGFFCWILQFLFVNFFVLRVFFLFVCFCFFSLLTAASKQITATGRMLCMHRGNLSVWIQHLSHQLTYDGSYHNMIFYYNNAW